jgi:multidrug resistance efflux pump
MGWEKGRTRGNKTGGRKSGTPNKKSKILTDRLAELGFDPLEEAVSSIRQIEDPHHRATLSIKLLDFNFPRLKSIEQSSMVIEAEDCEEKQRQIKMLQELLEADLRESEAENEALTKDLKAKHEEVDRRLEQLRGAEVDGGV